MRKIWTHFLLPLIDALDDDEPLPGETSEAEVEALETQRASLDWDPRLVPAGERQSIPSNPCATS